MNLQNMQRRLRKPTRFFFMTFLVTLSILRCAPFLFTKGKNGQRIFKVYTKTYQWLIYWLIWGMFAIATVYHMQSFIIYFKTNGLTLFSTINVIFIVVYGCGFLYSLCFAFNGKEAAVLYNTATGLQRSEILRGIAWDMDFIIQSFAVQILPVVVSVTLISSMILPWLYPDAPWLLCKAGTIAPLPIYARVAVITAAEVINISVPLFLCLGAPSLFLVGFTVLKLAMKRLR